MLRNSKDNKNTPESIHICNITKISHWVKQKRAKECERMSISLLQHTGYNTGYVQCLFLFVRNKL